CSFCRSRKCCLDGLFNDRRQGLAGNLRWARPEVPWRRWPVIACAKNRKLQRETRAYAGDASAGDPVCEEGCGRWGRFPVLPRRPVRGRNLGQAAEQTGGRPLRSEEHTSELQSRENLVCRLLLEKKNE